MWVIIGSLIFFMVAVFGGEIIVDSPKVITKEWEEKVFGIKYGVTTLDNSIHEMVDGLIDDYFDQALFDRLKTELSNQPSGEGEFVEYWENGKIKVRLPFKNGRAHGHIHGWYDNSIDAFKGHFNEGVKQGIHITFYKVEQDYIPKRAKILRYNLKGELDGKVTVYHATGRLWIILRYENGVAHGPLEGWDSNVKHFLSALYKNGVLQKDPPLPPGQRPPSKLNIHPFLVKDMVKDFQKKVQKEFGVSICGHNGEMANDIKTIGLDFNISKNGTIELARALLIDLTEYLTEAINQDIKLRPYLREFPFSKEKAEISLSFYHIGHKKYKDNIVDRVYIGRNQEVIYCSQEPRGKIIHIYRESYEEALKIVRAQQAKAAFKKPKKAKF